MIAISYRREDSLPVTGRLYDRLQSDFGKSNVFMDFDSIPYGVDFRDHIRHTLEKAKVLVVMIGPHWLGKSDKARSRIEEPNDFVRLEVAEALRRGIPVIPVLINNTPMPPAELLPDEIRDLSFRNGLTLDSGIDFHHHASRLVSGIENALSGQQPQVAKEKTSAEQRGAGPGKKLLIVAAVVLLVAAIAAAFYFKTTSRPRPAAITTESPKPTPETEDAGVHAASPAAFIENFVASLGQNDAATQIRYYARRTDYYDNKQVARESIRRELQRDINTWPHRTYTINGTPKITPVGDGFTAEFQMNYSLSNEKGASTGALEMTLHARQLANVFHITEIKKTVIEAQRAK